MELTEPLLEELARRWREQGAAIARRLETGLTDRTIDEIVEPLGLRVPPEARVWWRWHDGARGEFIVADGGKYYLSLRHCVEIAASMRRVAREAVKPYGLIGEAADSMARDIWNWDWLPLCEDGTSGMLVLDARADAAPKNTTEVLYRAVDDGSVASPMTSSMGDLVRCWIRTVDSGATVYDRSRKRWVANLSELPPDIDARLL